MQDRYAGDVGDFLKLGLLRSLCSGTMGGSLRLGVCWYLVPDESHNTDGKHVSYLLPDNRHGRTLSSCDPELFLALRAIVERGHRSVSILEASGVLPPGTVTYRARLRPAMAPLRRQEWHLGAIKRLADANLVFLDPDNGIRPEYPTRFGEKYVIGSELVDYLRRGQTVVAYQHANRTGAVEKQVQQCMARLHAITGSDPLGAVIARRGSVRFFVLLPSPDHRKYLQTAAMDFAARWGPHAEYHRFGGHNAGLNVG